MYHLRFVSLLIFCFDDLSISVSGVLKSPTIIVLLSISPLMPVRVCVCIEVFLCWVHKLCRLLCSVFLGLLQYSLNSILSEIRIATLAFF